MGAIIHYLELRAQGRTREHSFLKSWKAVQHMLEDVAAMPNSNQSCKFKEVPRATFLMDFSPSKLRIASTHGDHSVRVSNALTGKCTHILTGHPRTPWCLAFSPTSDDILASGCLNGEIRIWDLMGGGSEVLQNPCNGQVITSLAFHPGGEVLAFATMNFIYFWDWSSGPPFAFTQTAHESERVRWLKFDPFGHFLYTGIGNLTGFSRDAATGDVIVGSGVVDDAGDAANAEERRNRGPRNRPRFQLPVDRLASVWEHLPLLSDIHSTTGNVRPHESSNDPQNPNRSRHAAGVDGISVHNPTSQNILNFSHRLFPIHPAGSEAQVLDDNRPAGRAVESIWSQTRQEEAQPRQRWGRYEPSFFTRADFNCLNGTNSGRNSSNHNFASRSYRSDSVEKVATRINTELPSFRQRAQQLRPSPRTNLFPAGPDRSAGPSKAASFNVLPRDASGGRNADSENIDSDEFHIVPIDQGQNSGGRNTQNVNASSASLVNESPSVNSSLLQQQIDFRTLLVRYESRSNEDSVTTSGNNTDAKFGSTFTSPALLPSAASTEDHNSANTGSSMLLLAKEAKSNSLPPEETRTTHLCPTNSIPTLVSSAFCDPDDESSFEIPSLKPISSSISTTEHTVSSCESEGTSAAAAAAELPKHCNPLSANHESSSGACDKSSNANHLSQDVSFQGADGLKNDDNSSEGSVVSSTDKPLQINLGLSCAETIPVPLQNLLAESTEIALRVQDQFAGSSSARTGQHTATRGKTVRFEQDSFVSEQNGSVKWQNRMDGSNTCSQLKEMTQQADEPDSHGLLSNSRASTSDADKPRESSSLQKYKSVHSKVNTVKLSTARIRLYEAESKIAGRNTQGLPSGNHGELSRNGESSAYSNLLHNDVHVRSARANPQSSNFGLSRPENIQRSGLEPASRSDGNDIDNPLLRSSVPWESRARWVQSWIQRLPEPGNSDVHTSESHRTQRQEYFNLFVRPDTSSRIESSAARYDNHPSMSVHQNQTSRSTATTHGRHTLDSFVGLDYRNQLPVFQDRQIPRPVADQTSQTLGAMSLPASSDQGTDVVGLNEVPLDLSQTASSLGNNHYKNVIPGSANNSISECGRVIRVERAEPANQRGLNLGVSPNETHQPLLARGPLYDTSTQAHHNSSFHSNQTTSISGSSASRALHLFTDTDPGALESDRFHTSTDIPRSSRSLASSLGFRPVRNGINNEQTRFHPYSLHHGSDSLHPRALHSSSRQLMNSYCTTSDTASGAGITSGVPAGSSAHRSIHHGSVARQTSISADGASRLRQLNEAGQPSAFSAFSISSRETSRNPSRLRPFTSNLGSDSLPYQSHLGVQLSTSSQNSSQSSVGEQNTRRNPATVTEGEADLQESSMNISEPHRASARNLTWQPPSISLENQAAFTEYLERRVIELDRRLTNLEHSYSSRLRELHQDHQWRRSFLDTPFATRLQDVDTGPLPDPRSSLFPRPVVSAFPRPMTAAQPSSSGGTQQAVSNRQLLECVRRQNPIPIPRETAIPPTYMHEREDAFNDRAEREMTAMGLLCPLDILRPIQLHPDDARLMLLEAIRRRSQLERGANTRVSEHDLGGDISLGGQTHRIQQWDISKCPVPDITDASVNIVVRHCKLHNDASCNLAHDGSLLATLLPGSRGFLDNVVVGLFSLKRQSFGQCLYTRSFGSHAISLSISPLNRYLLVGLASKRTMYMTSSQMVGQVFKLVKGNGKKTSMKHHKDIYHIFEDDRYNYVSVNSARWLPGVGEGLVYGTNRGDLNFFRAESRKVYDKVSLDDTEEESRQRTTRNSIATQTTTVSIRRSASTQTANESEERMDIEEDEEERVTQVID